MVSTTETTDDDVFGTTERKQVGDSWPVNAALMVKDLDERGDMKITDVSGSAKLLGLAKVNGLECLDVSAEALIVFTEPPKAQIPEGATVEKCQSEIRVSSKLPLDLSLPSPETVTLITLRMTFIRKGDAAGVPDSNIQTTLSFEHTDRVTPVDDREPPAAEASTASQLTSDASVTPPPGK